MAAPLREQLQDLNIGGKPLLQCWIVVITQDRMIDDNFKREIKNQTFHTCRLFLLT